jgi:hypothetical protein
LQTPPRTKVGARLTVSQAMADVQQIAEADPGQSVWPDNISYAGVLKVGDSAGRLSSMLCGLKSFLR